MNTLDIELKINNNKGDLTESIAQTISNNHDEFIPLFEKYIDMGSGQTTIFEDSLRVESDEVHIDDDLLGGIAHAMFDSHFYAGCKDMNSVDEHEIELPFEIQKNKIIFNIEIPKPWVITE